MDNMAIEAKNLTKIYSLYANKADRLKDALFKRGHHKDFYALKDVSFKINEGENVGFIGKNGSGKSTLLKILTGVLTPTSGSFEMRGRVSALLELGAGFNPEYTGVENIYLNGTLMGYTKSEIDEKLEDIVSFADIGDFISQPVKTYSSGMYVRLAFAVAINVDPDILIVDEALSVGDIFFQQKCYKKFENFKENNKTILFVTHDLNSVIKYCDRAYLLNEGVLLKGGTPHEIVDGYKKIMSGIDITQNLKDGLRITTGKSWKSYYPINNNALSYGSLELEIIDYGIFDENGDLVLTCQKGRAYTIKLKIHANETVIKPIVAISIKDVQGYEITGTNTEEENVDTGTFESGATYICAFTQKINLQRNQYFLSFGCTKYMDDGFLKIFNRLYDIIELPIVAEKQSFGYFDMNSEINITKLAT